MTQPELPVEGGCRCGQVRFRVSAPPQLTMACHCTGCQRMTSSAFSLSAAIPANAFEVIAGEPVVGGLRGNPRHYFCPQCMSWLYTVAEGLHGFVNVRPTMLDQPQWNEPFIETYASEKLAWVTTPAVHSFPQFPAFDQFEGLVAAYREWAGA
jgi:hypothetical protein